MGLGWDKSVLGDWMSCVAVCEIIDDPSVKCKLQGMVGFSILHCIGGDLVMGLGEKKFPDFGG